MAIHKITSDCNGGNARLLRTKMDGVSRAWLAFKDKMRNYHRETFSIQEVKDQVKLHYRGRKEACEVLNTTTEELHLAAISERNTTRNKMILVEKQQLQNLKMRLLRTGKGLWKRC